MSSSFAVIALQSWHCDVQRCAVFFHFIFFP